MTSDAEQQAAYRARVAAGAVGRVGAPVRPIAHGTERGAAQHRRRGEPPCDGCRAAESAARKMRITAQNIRTGDRVRNQ